MDTASTDILPEQPIARPPLHASARSTSVVMQNEDRRQSDVALPPWQPDSEQTHCPVCGRQFTLFYRKHHCRRCGRVVCSACSPHRITIPHQFIVRPEWETNASLPSLTRADINSSLTARNPALGGGQEVRVCNPCVPDPNFSPPPQYNERRRSDAEFDNPPGSIFAPNRYAHIRHPVSNEPTYRRRDNFDPDAQPIARRDSRASANVFNAAQMRFPLPVDRHHPFPAPQPPPRQHQNMPSSSRPPNEPPSSSYPEPTNRETLRHVDVRRPWIHEPAHTGTPSRPIYGFYDPSESVSSALRLVDRRMARQQPRPTPLSEEDMCPACGRELPPKGPNGETEAREAHVRDCIDACFNPNLNRSSTSQSLPNRERSRTPSTHASSPTGATISSSQVSVSGLEVAESSSSTTPHRFSLSRPSMFEYTASEKDCLDGDGKPAECIICFEEFEQGDQMGRLVCWCRFHRTCIRDWWERKGPGACPTHQLGV